MEYQRLKNYGLIFFILMAAVVLGTIFFETWIRYVEGAALIGAGIGLLKLVYESNKTRKLKEAEFVASLNRDFNANALICSLYQKLEHDYRKQHETTSISEEDVVSFVVYLTFFETLHDLIQKDIIKIETIDDLFGYRFFIMVHNPYIQAHELTHKDLIESYVNIFKLYDKWTKHRIRKAKNKGKLVKDSIILWQHNLYDHHPEFLSLISRRKRAYDVSVAKVRHIFEIWRIQQRSQKQVLKENRHLFEPSSFFSIALMVWKKEVLVRTSRWGIQGYVGLVPVHKIGKTPYRSDVKLDQGKILSIDTMMVDSRFRNQGIQKLLIDKAESYAMSHGYRYLCATVSPDNAPSLNNFMKSGFYVAAERVRRYGNKERHVIYKEMKKGDSM